MKHGILLAMIVAVASSAFAAVSGPRDDPKWPTAVPGFVPPGPGEHPRLFFRKAEVAKLRQRAQTPEGKAIVERCKFMLGGAADARLGADYSLWDGAAYGFLYQMTGDKKYADLGRKCVEHAWEKGVVDRDNRYSLNPPNEPMRAGPSLSAVAMAYDLCYDAWDAEFRKDQAQKMMTWSGQCKKRGGAMSLERLSMSPDNPNAISNHFGLQVGGAGLTVLALAGDPELTADQQAKLEKYQQGVDKHARKVMWEDFGEGGYFGEHAGPGVISMTWTFTPWLLAERVAHGRDWLSSAEHPNPRWMSLRFVMQTLPTDHGPMYTNPAAGSGGYGGDVLVQEGGHHSTYFVQGFGAIPAKYKPAMLWVYQNFVEPYEHKQYAKSFAAADDKSYDVFSYAYRAMFAMVNWPFDVKAENPETVLPKVCEDRRMGQYIFRNRWKDKDDVIVAILFGSRTGDKLRRSMVWGLGEQMTFGNIVPAVVADPGGRADKLNHAVIDAFEAFEDGSGVVSAGGNAIGVDYSQASGADGVVVMVGPGATAGKEPGGGKVKIVSVDADGVKYSIMTLSASGKHPEAKAEGKSVVLGGQTVSFDGKKIGFAKTSGALKLAQ